MYRNRCIYVHIHRLLPEFLGFWYILVYKVMQAFYRQLYWRAAHGALKLGPSSTGSRRGHQEPVVAPRWSCSGAFSGEGGGKCFSFSYWCMYIYIYTYVHIYIILEYACIHTYIHTYMCVYDFQENKQTKMCTCMYVYVYIYMYAYIIYIYIYIRPIFLLQSYATGNSRGIAVFLTKEALPLLANRTPSEPSGSKRHQACEPPLGTLCS